MKKKPRPRKPRSPRSKSEPSALSQFRAAMKAEDRLEAGKDRRSMAMSVIFGKIAKAFPPSSDGLAILSIDIDSENILETHECVRCSKTSNDIGYIQICPDLVCVYPVCRKCGKLASVPGPVSEEIAGIVHERLGIEQ